MTEYADDSEIHDLLRQAQAGYEPVQKAAWAELQRYRREALAAVKTGEDQIERELRVALARGKLKTRLMELLKDG
jgi:hypothetical protein